MYGRLARRSEQVGCANLTAFTPTALPTPAFQGRERFALTEKYAVALVA